MAGISLVGKSCSSAKARRDTKKGLATSSHSFLPKDVGRKNLVSSPETAARYEILKKASGEISSATSQDVLKLPELKSSQQQSHSFSEKPDGVDYLQMAHESPRGSRKVQKLVQSRSQGKFFGRDCCRVPSPIVKQHGAIANPTHVSLVEPFGRSMGRQLAELEHKKQFFLPKLHENCTVVGRGKPCSSSQSLKLLGSGSGPIKAVCSRSGTRKDCGPLLPTALKPIEMEHTRGTRRLKSGRIVKKSPVKPLKLPSLIGKTKFDDELFGKPYRKSFHDDDETHTK